MVMEKDEKECAKRRWKTMRSRTKKKKTSKQTNKQTNVNNNNWPVNVTTIQTSQDTKIPEKKECPTIKHHHPKPSRIKNYTCHSYHTGRRCQRKPGFCASSDSLDTKRKNAKLL